jgi:predicted dehydrogenase
MRSFAILGCGHAGARHAEILSQYGRLVACVDPNPEAANRIGSIYKAQAFVDLKTALSAHPDLFLLSICSPNGLHAAQTCEALEAGIRVVCEKPMALRYMDAQRMIDTAERTGKDLFIVKQHRFNPALQLVKSLLDNHLLGRIYSVQVNAFWERGAGYFKNSWHEDPDMDGGVLFTQFSHFIDMLFWLFDSVELMHAHRAQPASSKKPALESQGLLHCKLGEFGAMASMHYSVNAFNHNREGSLTVLAENGYCRIGGNFLELLETVDIVDQEGQELDALKNRYALQIQENLSLHQRWYAELFEQLDHGGHAPEVLRQSAATVRLIEQAYQIGTVHR